MDFEWDEDKNRENIRKHEPQYHQIIPMRVVENLSEPEVRLLKHMIKKWINYLEVEESALKRRLDEAFRRDDKPASMQHRPVVKR